MGAESVELDRDALIEKNLPLVGYQVAELLRRVPSFVQREDLASAGSLALVQAAKSYNPETGVPFHRYAVFRIRGAMLDELRAMDWATRGSRSRTKQLEEMTAALTAAAGRAPTREELAVALGFEVGQVEAAQLDASRRMVSIDVSYSEDNPRSIEIVDDGLNPEDTVLTDERLVYLKAAVKALPPRLRYVVEQVFFEEKSVNEVAASLGVTQSRVSQLRTEALSMIRDGMVHHLEPDDAAEAPHEPQQKVGIVEKRRQSYLKKVADTAEALRETAVEDFAAGGGTGALGGAVSGGQVAPVHEVMAPHEQAPATSRAKTGATPRKTPAVQAKLDPLRPASSTTSFLASRSKGSAQARAQLRAEAEVRAAEEEKRKSKDKVRVRRTRKTPAAEPPPEPSPQPPMASYLGGLSLRAHGAGGK
ncbi:sigma-70 family RNA polymerase sigma factor [Mobiluncus mulieris]|uniref:Sigma-70 family RNA polymerase sigma factor n=1 Tax=Mobiluncus mulieris TaxID=2052 RepID=A0A7Y0TZ37_9ACTO|nr:sigma-70 family RNA polymerase sigma factor [Mobiluncus mulieris]NMW63974.1 sigma-70 family RNA polymerase sigma factor [Mobiluncus mulieris]